MGMPMSDFLLHFCDVRMLSRCRVSIVFLCIRNVAKYMLPNDALHNFVKKLKAAVQTLELFLTEHFRFLTVALLVHTYNETLNNKPIFVQVNLCQKHLFLNQLTHNMIKDCSLIYKFST